MSSVLSRSARQEWRWKRHRFPLQLGVCFLSIFLAGVLVSFFEKDANGINLIWVANGLLLSYLLLAPRWRWPHYLGTGFAALLCSSLAVHEDLRKSIAFNVLNLLEVTVAASLLRRRLCDLPEFTETNYVLRFVCVAVLAAPFICGLLFVFTCSRFFEPVQWSRALIPWALSDGLGTAVITPACVAIFRTHFRTSRRWQEHWVYVVLLAIAAGVSFSTSRPEPLFSIYPLLILILLHKGLGWAAGSTLYVAGVAGWCTFHSVGPFAGTGGGEPSLLIQLFVASGIFMLYSVSVVLERQRASERRLQEIATLHALVTENSRDAILISDRDGQPVYVSSAIERITGWTREQIRHRATTLIHMGDLPNLWHKVQAIPEEGSTVVEYRVRKADGGYVWLEASIKTLKDGRTGTVTGALSVIRDISERKHAEARLEDANRALEALAVTDGLTGLANRRRFDQYLASEWRRSMRDQNPLSLLLLDVDFFKSYNDEYGHLMGDSCLKQIAVAATQVVARPGDLVARFGGEEFAVILPNTENKGALRIASEICQTVRMRKFAHVTNPTGLLSVSIGCATLIAQAPQPENTLVEMADQALYAAKRTGRNRVTNASGATAAAQADPGASIGENL